MPDRILKPDSGNDLVLQNDDASAKIEINEDGSIPVTGTLEGSMTVGSGKTLDISSGTFTHSTAQAHNIVQQGPGSGTLDVSSGTFTTSTAQKQAISATAFASGTKMIFQQTSAPTGWTKVTTSNDVALRVVSGTVGSGGSVAFETAFASHTPSQASGASVSNHTLTVSEIPSHTHTLTVDFNTTNNNTMTKLGSGAGGTATTSSTGGDGSHNHGMTQATYNAINLDVSYVDVIIASKD